MNENAINVPCTVILKIFIDHLVWVSCLSPTCLQVDFINIGMDMCVCACVCVFVCVCVYVYREWLSTSLRTVNTGESMEKKKPYYTVDGNVNWYSLCGEQYGGSLRN